MKKRQKAQVGAWAMVCVGLLILLVCALLLCRCGSGKEAQVHTSDSADTQSTMLRSDESESETDREETASSAPETTDIVSDTETADPTTDTPTSNAKKVAITFDDGPHATYTRKISDQLAKYGGHATFFVVGNRVKGEQGASMAYAYEQGNEIGIHGFTHTVSYATCDEATYQAELSQTADVIRKYTGETIRVMRPFGGSITPSRIQNCDYSVITWSVDSNDWKYKSRSTEAERKKNVDIIVNNILNNVKDGDIVLMHEIYGNSYDALCIVTEELSKQGYEFVTVSELLGNSMKPGIKYTSAVR